MNLDNSAMPSTDDLLARAESCKAALLALKPSARQQKTELFTLLYPVIVNLQKRHVNQKDILAVLKAHGLKLHPSRFNALLAQHAKNGDSLVAAADTIPSEVKS